MWRQACHIYTTVLGSMGVLPILDRLRFTKTVEGKLQGYISLVVKTATNGSPGTSGIIALCLCAVARQNNLVFESQVVEAEPLARESGSLEHFELSC